MSEKHAEFEQVDFQSLKVRAGALLQLKVGIGSERSFEAEYSGMLRGKALFVSLSDKVFNQARIKVGEMCVLSGFNGVSEFVLASPIIEIGLKPFPHIHLQYQEMVDARVVREEQRLALSLPAVVVPGGSAETLQTRLLDMNSKGALIESPQELGAPGAALLIKIPVKLEKRSVELSIQAAVRHTEQAESGGQYRVGLEFMQIEAADKLVLYYLLYTLAQQAG